MDEQQPKGLTEFDWDGILPGDGTELQGNLGESIVSHGFTIVEGEIAYSIDVDWCVWVDRRLQSAEGAWRLTIRTENNWDTVLLENAGPFLTVEDAMYRAVDFIGNRQEGT